MLSDQSLGIYSIACRRTSTITCMCNMNLLFSERREYSGSGPVVRATAYFFYLHRFDLFKLTASLSHQKGSACKSRNHGDRLPDQGDVVPATVLLLYRLRGP